MFSFLYKSKKYGNKNCDNYDNYDKINTYELYKIKEYIKIKTNNYCNDIVNNNRNRILYGNCIDIRNEIFFSEK